VLPLLTPKLQLKVAVNRNSKIDGSRISKEPVKINYEHKCRGSVGWGSAPEN
jgi:hypothetical protein